jgi:hypothetical protein
LLDRRQSVDAEGFRGDEPEDEYDSRDEQQSQAFLLQYGGVQSVVLTQLVHLLDKMETCEILEHNVFAIACLKFIHR